MICQIKKSAGLDWKKREKEDREDSFVLTWEPSKPSFVNSWPPDKKENKIRD